MKKNRDKLVLGVTGGIASGKSEIRRTLESAGCLGIDADLVGHDLMRYGEPAYQAVVSRYGSAVLRAEEEGGPTEIDRSRLGKIVFSDEGELRWLESVMHPVIAERIRSMIQISERPVVIEAIKLMDSELKALCQYNWLAFAGESVQIRRLMENRGYSYETAADRVEVQKSIDWGSYQFDAVINTAVPLTELRAKVLALWTEYLRRRLDEPSELLIQ